MAAFQLVLSLLPRASIPESAIIWCKFATGEFLLFTDILWCVCLALCFVLVKRKDDTLTLDFGMPVFMRSNIDLRKKDKMQCVGIRARPPWLGSQKI